MALERYDRIAETTTTTGTGDYTLDGAQSGFEAFTDRVSDGATVEYCVTDGTDYEVGEGTFTASGTTLSRDTIIQSSNGDAAVDWGSGSKDIFITLPASRLYTVEEQIIVDQGNTNATLGDTASAHLLLKNPESSGQTKVVIDINGVSQGGFRVDFAGNFNWHARGSQGHQFYQSVDNSKPAAGISESGLSLGGNAGQTSTARIDVLAGSASKIGQITKAAGSQTANLHEYRDSSDTVLTYVDHNGDLVVQSYNDAGRPAAGTAGRIIFNTDDGQLNVDDGTNWTLPDGTTT